MAKALQAGLRKQAFWLIGIQLLLVLGLMAILFIFGKWLEALSVLLGGVIAIVPNIYFTLRFFSHTSPREVKTILRSFYFAEVIKLLLYGISFILVVKWLPVSVLWLLIGFIVAQIGYWIAPWVWAAKGGRLSS